MSDAERIEPNGAPGGIDKKPSAYDPAPSHDGGATRQPSHMPQAEESEHTPASDPRTAAAVDVGGTGGTAA